MDHAAHARPSFLDAYEDNIEHFATAKKDSEMHLYFIPFFPVWCWIVCSAECVPIFAIESLACCAECSRDPAG